MSKETVPYTYLIVWTSLKEKIWYYGSRSKIGCHPDDFWVKYFTSSKNVKELREKLGEPDIKQIRRTFKTKEDAYVWEEKVLRRSKALKNKYNLNFCNAGKKFTCTGHSEETRKKISESGKGKNNSNYGKSPSEETRKKMSESRKGKGKLHSEETRKKMSESKKGENNPNYGKTFSEETRKKMSKSTKGENHPNYGKTLSGETIKKIINVTKLKRQNRQMEIIDSILNEI